MGIPSYFSHIIKKYGKIIKHIKYKKHVDNLYLDSNSIIYDCLRKVDYSKYETNVEFENALYGLVCAKIEEYIMIIQPTKKVFIAFDGIAPVAKLKQQKTRRYRSKFIDHITNEITGDTSSKWDSASITPGTAFMKNLDVYINNHFSSENTLEIIYSGADDVGEGEHKIFEYIRDNKIYHEKTTTFIYGLDSDLIMLCLNHLHISKKIYLFRESPDFAAALNESVDANVHCYLDIQQLSHGILRELGVHDTSQKGFNFKDKISDYIFISFMMGNDFLPHFPALNIRTNGIQTILETYKHLFNNKTTICKNNYISWKLFRELVSELSKNELMYIKSEYKIRSKWESRPLSMKTAEDKLKKFNEIPFRSRDVEHFIDPYTKGWQHRYYSKLFHTEINNVFKKQISINYLEGLEWTLKYYTTGCVNYRWFYKYEYPPLLEDLVTFIPSYDLDMISENYNTINNLTQLSFVLPKQSLHLLPEPLQHRLLTNYPEYYRTDLKFEWAFCKYFWESHPIMKYFDIEELEEIVEESK